MFRKLAVSIAVILQTASANQFFSSKVHHWCDDLDQWLKPENIDENKQPVIGIVSQTLDFTTKKDDHRFDGYKSYIMGAYVRYIQASGARVVPFVYNEPVNVTMEKLGKVNGVLFPGGGGDYVSIGKLIVEHAKKANDEGHFFPIWGTCLGFERLINFTAKADSKDIFEHFGAHHVSLPIVFTKDPRQTHMFCPMKLDAFRL